ncbi:MAG: 50S ribosomal protein L18 [Candidatus Kaelpia aquatica]|nr:50S ribosomal protein L18 [Candidatus Kaelpia aquatica]
MELKTFIKKKRAAHKRRHNRVRKKVSGTTDRPRLSIYISLSYIYAQIIDDIKGQTLVSFSSLESELKDKVKSKGSLEAAKIVGTRIAEKAKEAGVKKVVFDRSGYKYHGKVKTLADAAREVGLEF